jgi:hypothetical protein
MGTTQYRTASRSSLRWSRRGEPCPAQEIRVISGESDENLGCGKRQLRTVGLIGVAVNER